MAFIDQALGFGTEHVRDDMMERQLKDYVSITARLIWQRQSIFFAATALTAFYFDPARSIACYGAVLFTEVLDLILARRIREWTDHDPAKARRFMAWITFFAMLAGGIAAIGFSAGVGTIPAWWWMLILAADWVAAALLFIYLWNPKPVIESGAQERPA